MLSLAMHPALLQPGFRFAASLRFKVCFQEDFMFNRNRRSRVRNPIYKAFVISLLTIFSLSGTVDSFARHIINKENASPPTARQIDASGSITGTPWAGAEGITETTANIMARDK